MVKKKKAERCPGCSRHPGECWIMPCLVLETALSRGDAEMKAWAKSANVTVTRKDGKPL